MANFWVDKGVGGFRMDAIPYIKKPADFSDGPVDDPEGRSDIKEMTTNVDGILDYLREFKKEVTEGKDIFTVGEANGVGPDQLKYWVGKDGVFDMIFEFGHMSLGMPSSEIWCKAVPGKITDLKKALTASQEATATNGWYPIYFENHDQPRSIDHFFPDDADPVLAGRAMGTLLLTLRGTPFIYQGEELGYKNVAWDSIDDYDDLSTHNQYEIALQEGLSEEEAMEAVHRFSRDNARTPMQWDDSAEAGFTTGTPWLPVHEDYKTENAEAEGNDPSSVLSWYLKLSALRSEREALIAGDYTEFLPDSEEIYCFRRNSSNDSILVLTNFTSGDVDYDPKAAGIEDAGKFKVLCSSYEDSEDYTAPLPGHLRPYEAVVVSLGD